MDPGTIPILAALFLLVGALYASVGHAGASGYLAVMALVGVEALTMRPAALAINVVVAAIAFAQFARAGHFSWRLFWPLAIASTPAAFIGGSISLPGPYLAVAIGAVLLLTSGRMAWTGLRRKAEHDGRPPPSPPPVTHAMACGGGIGLIAGLTGTGGGIFLSPLMLLLRWADPKRTAATAALFILCNSAAGLAGVAIRGWRPSTDHVVLAAAAGVGGLAGARIGSRLATPRSLNMILALVLLMAGLKLVLTR